MLGFIVSTITFSIVARLLTWQMEKQGAMVPRQKFMVMVAATLISMGIGWGVDRLDGDADAPSRQLSVAQILHSGDPVLIAKFLIGIN
ncbi:histidine kinase [Novimethylophilus kurashikiensis]|uniref:Histidine kinase n=2 Tax=Novimethylophilus kurashikiensis TaxID=1825523 RepID=A0A2R5F880_9PROT|nr:histidine kinase [Novimethylophilus kurashikiensis]